MRGEQTGVMLWGDAFSRVKGVNQEECNSGVSSGSRSGARGAGQQVDALRSHQRWDN
jgi:hypothetical protein